MTLWWWWWGTLAQLNCFTFGYLFVELVVGGLAWLVVLQIRPPQVKSPQVRPEHMLEHNWGPTDFHNNSTSIGAYLVNWPFPPSPGRDETRGEETSRRRRCSMSIWLYMDVFDCMKMYFQLLRMYLVVYGFICIWLYKNVFSALMDVFGCIWVYLIAWKCIFSAYGCIWL